MSQNVLVLPGHRAAPVPEQSDQRAVSEVAATRLPPGLAGLVDEIACAGHGVIMTMGKGGVGNTTITAAVAVELAKWGGKVVLSTTDSAAHLAATLEGAVPGLTVARTDPEQEAAEYTQEVLEKAGKTLDTGARALL